MITLAKNLFSKVKMCGRKLKAADISTTCHKIEHVKVKSQVRTV